MKEVDMGCRWSSFSRPFVLPWKDPVRVSRLPHPLVISLPPFVFQTKLALSWLPLFHSLVVQSSASSLLFNSRSDWLYHSSLK